MARKLELQPEAFSQRLADLQQAMAERGLEGLIVFGLCPGRTGNLTYLTNFRPGDRPATSASKGRAATPWSWPPRARACWSPPWPSPARD